MNLYLMTKKKKNTSGIGFSAEESAYHQNRGKCYLPRYSNKQQNLSNVARINVREHELRDNTNECRVG